MRDTSAFEQYVGPITYTEDAGDTMLQFTIKDQHLNGDGFLHGGMMMTLASSALSTLVRHVSDGAVSAPLSINCDFVGPGPAGAAVIGRASITRRTRTVVFASVELHADGKLMMSATAVYRLESAERSPA
ncbi:MAG: PaaI family thioesterase [Parvibaculum sp.]